VPPAGKSPVLDLLRDIEQRPDHYSGQTLCGHWLLDGNPNRPCTEPRGGFDIVELRVADHDDVGRCAADCPQRKIEDTRVRLPHPQVDRGHERVHQPVEAVVRKVLAIVFAPPYQCIADNGTA
jgi:hypothetical protein